MATLLAILGLVLLLLATLDFLVVTIGVSSIQLVSHAIARGSFAVLRTLRPLTGPWLHQLSGPIAMVSIAAWWIAGFSIGWTLVFQGAARSVVSAATREPMPVVMDYAFVGHLLSTLGSGQAQAGSPVFAVISVFVGVNGMVVLTLGISFIFSTTQTVTRGRAFMGKMEISEDDEQDRSHIILHGFAEIVSALNSSPCALYYSSVDEKRRLAVGLVDLGRRLLERPKDFARYRKLLSDLPFFDTRAEETPEALVARLQDWSGRFELDERLR